MRILQLLIENFKNITIAEITPIGGTIIISGENGAGKSAILDAFWMALDQKGAIKHNPEPIKHGEKSAKVVVNLGKYVVTRTWTETKSYLKIENAEGAVFKGPGAMLASLIGELSFDPQAFTTMSEKEQLNTLLSMLDLPIDIPALDKQRDDLYKTRTLVNRDITALKGQRDGIVVPEGTPDDEVSTADIMADFQAASEQIAKNDKLRDGLKSAKSYKESVEAKIVSLKTQLQLEEVELEGFTTEVMELTTRVDELEDPDLEQFKCDISDVDQKNALVRKKQEREEINIKFNEKTADSMNITAAIEHIDKQKADAIKNASMPVPGLGFDESGVLYNGTKLKGCSDGEQLRVSVAMAMALNPKIRVIRITDGSLLDSSNMKIIEEMAAENDFQVWVEKVDESGKLGVFIQEGEIIRDNQAPVEQPVSDETERAQDKLPKMPMPNQGN